MALSDFVYRVLEDQRKQVVANDSPEITALAKDIAFYHAMLDAQASDPFSDADDDAELTQFLQSRLSERTTAYQIAVNQML